MAKLTEKNANDLKRCFLRMSDSELREALNLADLNRSCLNDTELLDQRVDLLKEVMVQRGVAVDSSDVIFSLGDRVRNVFGETGVVISQDETTVWVAPDKNTGAVETWHVTKTFAINLEVVNG